MSRKDQIKLGFILHGVGPGWDDWRHPDARTDASTSLQFYSHQARVAEAGKFDFLFVADSLSINARSSPHYLNRFEPLTILSALAGATSRIGLVATVTATYTEPFNLARQLMSLDHISGGRTGWNVVTSWLDGTAANFSRTEHPEHGVRYRLAGEHLDVVQGLWDSWEDDAHVADKATGVFVDPDKLHTLDHRGEFFQVKGPLNIKRSPQGQPVIFQAGASEDGKTFAASRADAIFVNFDDPAAGIAYRTELRKRVAAQGRNPDEVLILPGIRPIVAETAEAAEAKHRELANLTSIDNALAALGRPFNDHDFRPYDLDAPFPQEVAALGANSNQSAAEKILKLARDEGLTLRETALRVATPRSHFVGDPQQVADALQHWFEAGAADGYILFESLPGQLEVFVETVVPILQARGVFRRDYQAGTLRQHLGLPYPENRYTAARARLAAE